MVTYLGGSILITIFALSGSIVSYNLQVKCLSLIRGGMYPTNIRDQEWFLKTCCYPRKKRDS